jgi:hypothetical protein
MVTQKRKAVAWSARFSAAARSGIPTLAFHVKQASNGISELGPRTVGDSETSLSVGNGKRTG